MKRLVLLPALFAASPALAHLDPLEHGSFAAGFSHPVFGPDHLLAMLAVGLWAAVLGGRARWALPAGFVAAMAPGFALALAAMPLPFVEPMILASVLLLGGALALALRPPLVAGVALVGTLALFHGHAHGAELGGAATAAYLGGFVLATGLLHGAGVLAGLALARIGGRIAARGAGVLVLGLGSALMLAG